MRLWLLGAAVALAFVIACGGGDGSEAKVRDLSAKLTEYAKAQRWGDIYDLMSAEFKARCDREEFIAGIQSKTPPEKVEAFQQALTTLRFIDLENVEVQGDTASGEAVTEDVEGRKRNTQYFVKEDGEWHIAPDPGTQGCLSNVQ
ncbi:MAG: hypothetical protein Q8P22_07770 [Chloroflexota bacterium]|nr:hypothetical protein [Chloroflexota bacterium]